jgi:hypothetical protein
VFGEEREVQVAGCRMLCHYARRRLCGVRFEVTRRVGFVALEAGWLGMRSHVVPLYPACRVCSGGGSLSNAFVLSAAAPLGPCVMHAFM